MCLVYGNMTIFEIRLILTEVYFSTNIKITRFWQIGC